VKRSVGHGCRSHELNITNSCVCLGWVDFIVYFCYSFYLISLQLVITTILISLPIMFAFAANYQISKAKSTKMRGRLTNDSITKCSAGLATFQISLITPS
jgi:hypothetical protein